MSFKIIKNTVLLFVLVFNSCGYKKNLTATVSTNESEIISPTSSVIKDKSIIVAANQTEEYLDLLKQKNIGIIANQTSVIFKPNNNKTHLVDSLLKLGITIKSVFAPEHGFRGKADAGEIVKDGIDTKTGISIISLYGKNKKPNAEMLKDIDMLVFDIQDVGARFYTYISSLHYIMEACAENNITLLILDRPSPNGHYIDGPILEKEHTSFIGMHPIPVVHGMTIGEYAKMINGEGWLKNAVKCDITIVPVKNYTHKTRYSLPIKPSPNLPNDVSINLYPSLCFFEGTTVSIGRGTNLQFQIAGAPYVEKSERFNFEFTPQPNDGAKYPKHKNKVCYGYNLAENSSLNTLNLKWLIEFYNTSKGLNKHTDFFTPFFTKLAGTKKLQQQIENGLTESEIKASWQQGLKDYKTMRAQYLIYKD